MPYQDRVTVRNLPAVFHTRTQDYARGRAGVVVGLRPEWVIPEDQAWGRDEGRCEPFYMVRFTRRDLRPDYGGDRLDMLETEFTSGGWNRQPDILRDTRAGDANMSGSRVHDHDHAPME